MKQYKRLFTFGCSFTMHTWPTWADIMHKELKDSEYHNMGRGGAGQQYIYTSIIEANKKYKFNQGDLVMVMWSTHCREDRYVFKGKDNYSNWLTQGNIFNPHNSFKVHDEKFMREYVNVQDYFIRDLTLISLAETVLKATKADCKLMLSVPLLDIDANSDMGDPSEIGQFYKDLISTYTDKSVFETIGYQWSGAKVLNGNGEIHNDTHPTPEAYLNFLKNIGYTFSKEAEDYAKESTRFIHDNLMAPHDLATHFNLNPRHAVL